MAVHILFRPPAAAAAAAGPSGAVPPSPDATVRRSARLVLHPTPSPPVASSSTSSATKRVATSISKSKAGSSPTTSTSSTSTAHIRKRARPSEPQTSQTESESDSERPVSPTKARTAARHAPILAAAAAAPIPPTPEPTPRAVRAQKRQRLSLGNEAELPFRLAPAPHKRAPSPPPAPTPSPAPLTKSIPPPNATKTRAAKRKSMGTDTQAKQPREEEDLDREACPPLLKKKRKENAHAKDKASPGENNHPQTIKKAIKGKEKGKEKDVVNVSVTPAPTPRVVSLRPRRRSSGSNTTSHTIASKSTSPKAESIKDSRPEVPLTTSPLPSETDKAYSISVSKESEAVSSNPPSCPPAKEPSETPALPASIVCPSPSPSSPLSPLSTSPSPSPTPIAKPIPPPPVLVPSSSSPTPSSSNTAPSSSSPPPSPIRAAVHPHPPSHTHAITQPHIHSPLTPLAHTTTPPSSPPMHSTRTSPPLDAVDLGPLPPLSLPGPVVGSGSSSGSNSPNNGAKSAHSSPVSSPPLSPVSGLSPMPSILGLVNENIPAGTGSGSALAGMSGGAGAGSDTAANSILFAGASPITLPTIPTAAAAFLGPFVDSPITPPSQDIGDAPHTQTPAQPHHFIQPFDDAHLAPLTEGGMPLSMPMPMGGLDMGGMGMGMGMPLHMMSGPMGLSLPPMALGLPVSMPMALPLPLLGMGPEPMGGSIPASESELGFGFQPQEGFVGGGAAFVGEGEGERRAGGGEPVQQQQQQFGMAFEGGQPQQVQQQQQPSDMFGPESTSQFTCEPQQLQLQDASQQQQQQQQQQRPASPQPSMRLTLKQQRKLTYPDPTPLEDLPAITKDTGLWATACKLRIWEMSKRYTPDVIRAVTVQDAQDHYMRTGVFPLGHKRAGSHLRHHRNRSSLSSVHGKGTRRARRATVDGDGDEAMEDEGDDDEYMNERTYLFELLDDEELESGVGEGAWDEDEEMDGVGIDGGEYDDHDYDDEDEWDEEDDEEEDDTDEEEEIEEALEALKKSASMSPTSPTSSAGRATSPASPSSPPTSDAAAPMPKVVLTAEDGAVLSGDEDAEGEMEVDIEAFSDPSFNAELSSPTLPATPASPLSPDEGRVSMFYVPPPLAFPGQYGAAQTWVEEPTTVEASQPQMMQVDQQQQPGPQTPPPTSAPELEQQHQPQQALSADHQQHPPAQQQQQQQHQAPIQIQLTPAHQPYFPAQQILPLPPPRLDSIRVAFLRQAELGAKLTGRGTPADRARAAQWARGYVPLPPAASSSAAPVRLSPGKRHVEDEDEDVEGQERARPRLRLELGDGGEVQAARVDAALTLSLPDDVSGAGQPTGVQEGVHTVASDTAQWDAFLACLDEKPDAQHDGGGAANSASSSSTSTSSGHLEHVSVSAHASSAYTTPRPGSPAPPSEGSSSSSNTAPIATGEGMFSIGLFEMGFGSLLSPANAWFGSAESAPDASSSSSSLVAVGASEPQQESLEMKAAAIASGTSTLSFALG